MRKWEENTLLKNLGFEIHSKGIYTLDNKEQNIRLVVDEELSICSIYIKGEFKEIIRGKENIKNLIKLYL